MAHPPRVIDRHGVVTSIVDEGQSSYIITQDRVKGAPPLDPDGIMKRRRYYGIEPAGPEDPEDAVLYCKRGKHDVSVPMSELRAAMIRYRNGETQIRVFASDAHLPT